MPEPPESASPGAVADAAIGVDEVQSIAALARLDLSEAEAQSMVRDLDQMLHYVAALDELDTENVEPTAHALPLKTPTRPDEPADPMDPDLALANAPAQDSSAFRVPKVLASDEDG